MGIGDDVEAIVDCETGAAKDRRRTARPLKGTDRHNRGFNLFDRVRQILSFGGSAETQ